VLDGHLGNQTLTATAGPSVLIGGPKDTLIGGASADVFVFPQSFGLETVKNFTPGTDQLLFNQSMFANVAAVLSEAHQVGSNVVIAHDPQNVVTLQNTQLSALHASDIHII
jgi:Ca2+-binding RTX toxin-like protein